jgi:hypothetical protein
LFTSLFERVAASNKPSLRERTRARMVELYWENGYLSGLRVADEDQAAEYRRRSWPVLYRYRVQWS